MNLDPTLETALNLVGAVWVVMVGVFFVLTYVLYDRSSILHSVGDFFIKFSLIKRTKTILLSYGILAIIIGVLGVLMTVLGR